MYLFDFGTEDVIIFCKVTDNGAFLIALKILLDEVWSIARKRHPVGLLGFDFVGFFRASSNTSITSFLIVKAEVLEGNVEIASVQAAWIISDWENVWRAKSRKSPEFFSGHHKNSSQPAKISQPAKMSKQPNGP